MSRRRPRKDEPKPIKLVCTDRGGHAETLIGWLTLVRGDALPRFDDQVPADEIYFSTTRDSMNNDVEESYKVVTTMEAGAPVPGAGLPLETRLADQRFQLARSCPRCANDVPVKGARLAQKVREAEDRGESRLDASTIS